MAQHGENRTIGAAVELLKTNGFDGLAEAVTVLLNTAMKTRLGMLPLKVPQTRDSEFYPQSLERGLRSERALVVGDCRDVRARRLYTPGDEDRRRAVRYGD